MPPIADPLLFVKMKARRADEHFQSLEKETARWAAKPYSVIEKTDFKNSLHVFRIEITPTPEPIPMLFGDFICCLRSSLDQLAWRLAHIDSTRIFKRADERNINFPTFSDPWTYNRRRDLFPSTVARILDSLQPDFRGDAFMDDPLWQLDRLWTLDKHRTTPSTHYGVDIDFPAQGWRQFARVRNFPDHLEVTFPLAFAWASKMDLKPQVAVDILFGERSTFEVPLSRLSEINDFVRNEVIPRFAGFFPYTPNSDRLRWWSILGFNNAGKTCGFHDRLGQCQLTHLLVLFGATSTYTVDSRHCSVMAAARSSRYCHCLRGW